MKPLLSLKPHKANLTEINRYQNLIFRYKFGLSHSILEAEIKEPAGTCYMCYYYIPRDSKSFYLCTYHEAVCDFLDSIKFSDDNVKILPHLMPTVATLMLNMKKRIIEKPFLVHTVDPENHLAPIWLIAVVVNEPYCVNVLTDSVADFPDLGAKMDFLYNTFVDLNNEFSTISERYESIKKKMRLEWVQMGIAWLGVISKIARVTDSTDVHTDFTGNIETDFESDWNNMDICSISSFNDSLGQEVINNKCISFQGSLRDNAYNLYDADIQRAQDNLDYHTSLLANTSDISKTDFIANQIEQDKSDLRYWRECQNDAINTAKVNEIKQEYYNTMWEIASRKSM